MSMGPEISTYRALDGHRLHYRHWRPENKPRVQIVALHGIQSHSGWYEWSSERLRAAGFELFFLDRRGSGMNERDRGDVPRNDALPTDVIQFLSELRVKQRAGGSAAPVVLLGVSWGGKLATVAAAARPDLIDGLALLYPGLRARVRATWWQRMQLALAERLGIRRKRVPIPLDDPALFTGDPEWRELIRTDPLALRDVTVAFLLSNRELDRRLDSCPARVTCPTLLMLAGRDRIIDNQATREFVERFATSEKTTREYPNAQHTLEFEPDRERIFADLIEWLAGFDARRQVHSP